MDDYGKRISDLEEELKRLNLKNDEIPKWDSLREMWTVKSAVFVLLIIIIAIIINMIFYSQEIDSFQTIFSNITLAILGYLFGYVPTKSNLDKVETEKKSLSLKESENERIIEALYDALKDKEKVIDTFKTRQSLDSLYMEER